MVYLDNAATYQRPFMNEHWYNPNSPHELGVKSAKALMTYRDKVKEIFNIPSDNGKVIFGPTATSMIMLMGANLLIKYRNNISVNVEHGAHSSLDKLRWHEGEDKSVKLYCYTPLNNVTGMFADRDNNDLSYYYVADLTAAIGREYIEVDASGVDCIIGSAHKFGGPGGTGFMWVSDRFSKILDLSDDTFDEYDFYPGTPAVENIEKMVQALIRVQNLDSIEALNKRSEKLTNILTEELTNNGISFSIPNPRTHTPSILLMTLPGFDANALVQYLSANKIYVSPAMSACDSKSGDGFRVMKELGYTEEEAKSSIRISYSYFTVENDMKELAKYIAEFYNSFVKEG